MTSHSVPLDIVICQDRIAHESEARFRESLVAQFSGWAAVNVKVLPHLYDLSPDGPAVEYLRSVAGDLVVLAWLYPRAAYWILDANEVRGRIGHSRFFPDDELAATTTAAGKSAPPDRTVWCLDLRPHREAAPLVAEIERIVAERGGPSRPAAPAAEDVNGIAKIDEATRPRWYPVVDYSRCGTCLECLNFCLFGVFGLGTDGQLLVEQPDACRNGCPACARVCPSGAIMFPEHDNPAVAGDTKAPAADLNTDLLRLFGPHPARDLAAAERERILRVEQPARAEKPAVTPPPKSASKKAASADALDGLLDELDQSDL